MLNPNLYFICSSCKNKHYIDFFLYENGRYSLLCNYCRNKKNKKKTRNNKNFIIYLTRYIECLIWFMDTIQNLKQGR